MVPALAAQEHCQAASACTAVGGVHRSALSASLVCNTRMRVVTVHVIVSHTQCMMRRRHVWWLLDMPICLTPAFTCCQCAPGSHTLPRDSRRAVAHACLDSFSGSPPVPLASVTHFLRPWFHSLEPTPEVYRHRTSVVIWIGPMRPSREIRAVPMTPRRPRPPWRRQEALASDSPGAGPSACGRVEPPSESCAACVQVLGMSERGYLPASFARRSRFGTPAVGILLSSIGIFTMLSFSFLEIIEMLNVVYSMGELLEFAAYVWLRVSRPDLKRPFKCASPAPRALVGEQTSLPTHHASVSGVYASSGLGLCSTKPRTGPARRALLVTWATGMERFLFAVSKFYRWFPALSRT